MQHSQSKPFASPAAIWAAMLGVYIVWGSTYLAIHYVVQTIPPFLSAGIRFLISGSMLYLWQRRLSGAPRPTWNQWRSAAVVGFFLLVGGNGGVVWAEQTVPSGVASLLVGSSPLWMILLDALRLTRVPAVRRPGWANWLGVLVGFIGIVVLVGPSQLTGLAGDIDLLGSGVLTVAAMLWAFGSLYSRSADLPQAPLLGTGMEMLAGGGGLVLLSLFTGEWGRFNPAAISTPSLLGMGYLIFFGSLIGFGCYTWLLRNAPTTLVSTYAYVNPVVAIFIGNLIAGEAITRRVLLAAAIIIGAVALITLTQRMNHH